MIAGKINPLQTTGHLPSSCFYIQQILLIHFIELHQEYIVQNFGKKIRREPVAMLTLYAYGGFLKE